MIIYLMYYKRVKNTKELWKIQKKKQGSCNVKIAASYFFSMGTEKIVEAITLEFQSFAMGTEKIKNIMETRSTIIKYDENLYIPWQEEIIVI